MRQGNVGVAGYRLVSDFTSNVVLAPPDSAEGLCICPKSGDLGHFFIAKRTPMKRILLPLGFCRVGKDTLGPVAVIAGLQSPDSIRLRRLVFRCSRLSSPTAGLQCSQVRLGRSSASTFGHDEIRRTVAREKAEGRRVDESRMRGEPCLALEARTKLGGEC